VTVRLIDSAIVLEGDCPVEDAEALQSLLLQHPGAAVDWRACDAAHTAVLQVLLVAKPSIRGRARSAFLQDLIVPVLTGAKT
jgi:hypothetical protein